VKSRGSSPTVKEGTTSEALALLSSRASAPARSPSSIRKQGARANRLPVSVSGQITLLTDFGTADYYVAAVKGVILSINSTAKIIDITHDIPPQDIEAAAFTLLACYQSFGVGTIHIAVVDPGVGSSRRAILATAGRQFFVGPDNGIFSYVLDNERDHKVFQITANEYFRQPLSTTFHGRDVFAPIAAALSTGVALDSFGREIRDAVRLPALKPNVLKNEVQGRIIHVDRFGNCVTNVDRQILPKTSDTKASLILNGKRIRSFREFYGEGKADKGVFAIWGSAGFLEISAQNRSAAKILKAKRGDVVVLKI
jgi:S-adenosyl-L-methionine hydrolase (adenosine-forming)